MRFLSIVSGTSTDGLTMALVDLTGTGLETKFQILESQTFAYSREMRKDLLKIAEGRSVTMEFISRVHWNLGRLIDQWARVFGDSYDAISYSGHTVYHGPSFGDLQAGTFQIGEISVLVANSGKTAVTDFRSSDISYGGLGAPLTAVSDYFILKEPGTLAINIGGISNIAYVLQGGVMGFDTGPGNMLIDLAVQKMFDRNYDADGAYASQGEINTSMLSYLLKDAYLNIAPPKNTGREYFGEDYVDSLMDKFSSINKYDFLRTLTRFTSVCIEAQVEKYIKKPVERIVVGGGCTKNPLIMSDLKELFSTKVQTFSDIGVDDMSRECLGFAILANQTLHSKPGRMNSSGRVEGDVIGRISPGKNYPEIIKMITKDIN